MLQMAHACSWWMNWDMICWSDSIYWHWVLRDCQFNLYSCSNPKSHQESFGDFAINPTKLLRDLHQQESYQLQKKCTQKLAIGNILIFHCFLKSLLISLEKLKWPKVTQEDFHRLRMTMNNSRWIRWIQHDLRFFLWKALASLDGALGTSFVDWDPRRWLSPPSSKAAICSACYLWPENH